MIFHYLCRIIYNLSMAKLKIYNEITTEEESIYYQWEGRQTVCYKDVDTFCESIPEDDNVIDLRIFCDGGNVIEGWAIYDRLRATGKDISVIVEGKAASMATIIMMAAPKDKRKAYSNTIFKVHNPWIDGFYLHEVNANGLRKAADDLQREQDKMLDLYEERCECSREEMQALMDEDKWIGTDEAIRMGLIAEVIPPISAKANYVINKSMKNKKNMVSVEQTWLDKVLSYFGKAKVEDVVFGLSLTTTDGQTINVEREEGEPQVGDAASPDGTFTLEDGRIITIENGVITDIKSAVSGTGEGDGGNGGETTATDDDVDTLRSRVAELEAEVANLKSQLEESAKNAKSAEDKAILSAVKLAGGIKALDKLKSNYNPVQRNAMSSKVQEHAMSREEGCKAILANMKKNKR